MPMCAYCIKSKLRVNPKIRLPEYVCKEGQDPDTCDGPYTEKKVEGGLDADKPKTNWVRRNPAYD